MLTLVLVPGLLTDSDLFAAQSAGLSDIARVVIADVTQDDSIAGMATRLLASVEGEFALAGLSMGGYVAQEVMRQAPQRVHKLALLDTNARADRPEQSAQRQALIEASKTTSMSAIADQLLPVLVHPRAIESETLVARIRAMAEHVGAESFARQQTAIMTRVDGRADLARITIPTLCLCGQQDALTPPKVHQEMVDLLPHGTLVEIENCGHLSTMEQPEAVTALFRYWLLR